MVAPSDRYLSGLRRKSTTSVSSPFTSSMPATSANVVRGPVSGSYRLARDRPIPPSPPSPPPAAARRMNQMSSPMNSRVGPKPTRTWVSSETWSGGRAFTVTPLLSSSSVSPSSPKDGRWVVKSVTSLASPLSGGYFAVFRKLPSMVSPVEVTSPTLPACTCSRKKVYDTVVRDVPISVEAMIQLTTRASSTSHQVRRATRPQLGLVPLPSPPPVSGGAPSTFHGGRCTGRSRSPGRSAGRCGAPGRGGASVARPAIAFSPGSFAGSTPTNPLVAVLVLPTSPGAQVCPVRARPAPLSWHSRLALSRLTARLREGAPGEEVLRAAAGGGGRGAAGRGAQARPAGGGLQRGRRARRRRGAAPGPRGRPGRRLRGDRARHHAARAVRLPGLRAAAGRGQLGAGAHAVRQGRRVRRGRRAGRGRGRLPDQAVLLRGTGGPAARAAAPGGTAAPGRARRRRPRPGPGQAPGHPWRDRDRADAAGVLAAGVPAATGRRGRPQGRHPAQRLGPAPRGRSQRRRGVRGLPAPEDRHPVRAAGGADRAWRRLPAGRRRWIGRPARLPGPPGGRAGRPRGA